KLDWTLARLVGVEAVDLYLGLILDASDFRDFAGKARLDRKKPFVVVVDGADHRRQGDRLAGRFDVHRLQIQRFDGNLAQFQAVDAVVPGEEFRRRVLVGWGVLRMRRLVVNQVVQSAGLP